MSDIKTLEIKVKLEIRADADDESAVREEIKTAMQEAIDNDEFEFEQEEVEE